MQNEINRIGSPTPVRILGVGEPGYEAAVTQMCNGVSLPWLQDTVGEDVAGLWEAVRNDLVIVDAENRRVRVISLAGENSIQIQANYDELKRMLLDLAGG